MKIEDLEEYAGRSCQIISKISDLADSNVQRAFYDVGTIMKVDHDKGTILVDTQQGIKRLHVNDLFEVLPLEGW